MLVLAFDTSSPSGSVAIVRDGALVAELTVGNVGTHADWLMNAVTRLLGSAGIDIKEVDLFAVDNGPGSFTGLRIGVATVKGLAWALGKKVAGVSTLESLALNLRYSGLVVCPLLDARKGEVYSALYRFNGAATSAVMEDSVMAPEALFRAASEVGSPVVFLGGGLNVYGEAVRKNVKGALVAPEALWHIRASNVALLALQNPSAASDPSELLPAYLRKSEAELKAGK
ncbi:MAG: tRNA (adenosine(37)-N6)-threonylcarbamoyltransferase complex dimerization subunit type 1 TsaB [Deltaproteobacteria bacterium]|nr:tRNA (adenosine(37)-N6)-threonylcarbamoyltransferase complex dimerization subunit type 1 TsaB [Deltaproteobacteria bacterium]